MTETEGVVKFDLLPNRFAAADFDIEEAELIAGRDPKLEDLSISNFNWTSAYLVEQVALHEIEVTEWFRSAAQGLGGRTPLQVWRQPDGFLKVMEYARQYREQVIEDIGEVDNSHIDAAIVRSKDLAMSALGVLSQAFKLAGVELVPDEENLPRSTAKHLTNPDKPDSPIVRWKGNGYLEDYRISIGSTDDYQTYYFSRCLGSDEIGPFIMQAGIVRFRDRKQVVTDIDSDIDGRPPSAGEVSPFVVAVANESRNRALTLMQPE